MTFSDNILHTTTTTNYTNTDLNQITAISINGNSQPVSWDNNLNLSGLEWVKLHLRRRQ